jgi:primase-polymerase (primpol)-like protein
MAVNALYDGPPATLPVVASGIPEDVQALPQFVVWDWEYRDNHWRKPPLRADGLGYAASNDARTWACCDEALAAYQRRNLGGIGFAIASDDPFFFIDLDDCRDPLTGDVDSWAAQVLDRFRHTYQEVSPSATGFKILGLGTPPIDQYVQPIAGARPRAKVEVFASIKYTTLSGHRLLEAPATVNDAQSALKGGLHGALPASGWRPRTAALPGR